MRGFVLVAGYSPMVLHSDTMRLSQSLPCASMAGLFDVNYGDGPEALVGLPDRVTGGPWTIEMTSRGLVPTYRMDW